MTVVLMVLLTAWTVFGQEAGKGAPAGARVRRPADVNRPTTPAAKEQKFFVGIKTADANQPAPPEGRRPIRPPGMGREEQLKAVAAIEAQVAKLKALIEAQPGPEEFAKMKELPEEERTKSREKFARAREERQKVIETIEQNVVKLRGERPRIEEQQKLIGELQAIRDLAKQEKAEGTTKRLEQLIDRQQKASEGMLPVPRERPAGRVAPTPRPPVPPPPPAPQPEPGKKP